MTTKPDGPDLTVDAVAGGGTPANLRQISAANEGTSNFGLVLAAGIGMDAAYPALDLESYLAVGHVVDGRPAGWEGNGRQLLIDSACIAPKRD